MIPHRTSCSTLPALETPQLPRWPAPSRPKGRLSMVSRRCFLSLFVVLLICVQPASAEAEGPKTQVNFADIIATNAAEYATYQVKFTYTGKQSKTTPSLLLTGSGRSTNAAEFIPYRSAEVHYGNDDVRILALSVSGTTIQKLIGGLAERPQLQTRAKISDPVISLMIERGLPPNERVFEHLATDIEASELMNLLQGAARSEPAPTRETVRQFRNFTLGPN
jgi:hypothetical protein